MRINGRHLSLDNLYRMVRHQPQRGEEIIAQYLQHLLEGEAASSVPLPFDLARTKIMPRVQPEAIFDHLERHQVVHQPFVNDTVVLYVIDMPHMTFSITVEQMLKWQVDLEEIDRQARRNLMEYVPELEIRFVEADNGGKAAIVSQQDGYDASRLLLVNLHGLLSPVLGPDFLVATPSRDTFVALSGRPHEFADHLRKKVLRDYARLPYPITHRYFVVTRDGIAGTASDAA